MFFEILHSFFIFLTFFVWGFGLVFSSIFRWFMVSYLSEEEVLKKFRFWWNVHRATGAGLLVIGVYFVAQALNEI